jgi:two-component sensor histidine kinase
MQEVEARFAPVPETTTELEARILRGLAAGDVGVWSWDMQSQELYWTPNLELIHQLPPGHFDGTFSFFQNDIHSDDRDRVKATIEQALARGGAYEVEYRLLPKDGEETRWLEARGRVLERDGEVIGMTGICQDITDRKRGERELARRTHQQEAIVRLGQLALTGQGDNGDQSLFDAAVSETAKALGVEMCKILELMPGGDALLLRAGVGWKPGLVGTATVGTELGSQAGYTLKVSNSVVVDDLSTETRFSGPSLLREHGVVSGASVIIAGMDGRAYGVLGAHTSRHMRFSRIDVEFLHSVANLVASAIHRNRALERQELLIHELRHRVGNLLSLITSLFNNSARSASSIAELEEKFQARVMSLSRAHSMILEAGWRATSLRGVVDAVLEPYLERIGIEGGDVRVSADNAVALSLALHELATNAAKYGALSTPDGWLTLRWSKRRDGDRILLAVNWHEEGGPTISAPSQSGFGSKLVTTVIERQLNGELKADYLESGLRLHFEIPVV